MKLSTVCCRLAAGLPLSVVLGLLLVPTRADAYTVQGPGWRQSRIMLEMDPSLPRLTEGGMADLAEGLAAWRGAGAPEVTLTSSETDLPREMSDRRNVVAVVDHDWPFASGLKAATVIHRSAWTREILAADIYINAVDFRWAADGFDLQSCITHELGHFFDLGHEEGDPHAVMFHDLRAGEQRRTPTDDDRAGVDAIYGAPSSPMGCSSSRADGSALLVAAAGLLRRRRVNSSGSPAHR